APSCAASMTRRAPFSASVSASDRRRTTASPVDRPATTAARGGLEPGASLLPDGRARPDPSLPRNSGSILGGREAVDDLHLLLDRHLTALHRHVRAVLHGHGAAEARRREDAARLSVHGDDRPEAYPGQLRELRRLTLRVSNRLFARLGEQRRRIVELEGDA